MKKPLLVGILSLTILATAIFSYTLYNQMLLEGAKTAVLEELNDPYTAQIRNLKKINVNSKISVVCGEVNAKNLMNAYVGYKRFMYDLSGTQRADAILYENTGLPFSKAIFENICEQNKVNEYSDLQSFADIKKVANGEDIVLITEIAAKIRTAVTNMVISGIEMDKLRFNPPSDLGKVKIPAHAVFGEGRKDLYQLAPATIMANGKPGKWVFNTDFVIPEIGDDTVSTIAFLAGIKPDVCTILNRMLISDEFKTPKLTSDLSEFYAIQQVEEEGSDYKFPPSKKITLKEISGQPFGCFEEFSGGTYVYFHALLEGVGGYMK